MHVLNDAHLPAYIKKSIKIRQMEKKVKTSVMAKKLGMPVVLVFGRIMSSKPAWAMRPCIKKAVRKRKE